MRIRPAGIALVGVAAVVASVIQAPSAMAAAPSAPGVSTGSAIKIVVDNDFAILVGNSTNVSRLVYNNNVGWGTQVSDAASIEVNLAEGETYIYIIPMGGGGTEDFGGRLGSDDITGVSGAQYAVRATGSPDYLEIQGSLTGYNTSAVADGTFNVTLAGVEAGLTGATWASAVATGSGSGTPPSYKTSGVGATSTGMTGRAWGFPDSKAVAFRYPASAVSLPPVPGDSQVKVYWSTPTNTGGFAITDYVIQYRTTTGPGAWQTFSDGTSTGTSATVTGLTNGTSYDFQVAAVNSRGTGSYSSSITPVWGTTVAGAPISPTSTAGNAQVTVTWAAPSSNGGAAITDYVIEYRAGSGSWLTFADGTSASTTALVTGLTNGTAYEFRVSAVNANGRGSASSTTSATPLAPSSGGGSSGGGGGSSSSDSPSSTTPSTTTPSTTTPSTGGAGVMTPSPVTQRPNPGAFNQLPVGPAPATVQVLTTPTITTDPNRLVATTINDLRSTKGAAVAARVQAALEASIPSISSEIAAATTQLATVLSRRNAPQSEVIRAQANLANATSLVILRTLEATGGNLTSLSLPITEESRLPQVRPEGVLVVGPDGAKAVQRTVRDNSTVVVREVGGSFSLAMSVIEEDGQRAPVSAQGTVQAAPGQKIAVAGNGYRPRSPVVMWVFSSPRNLGTVMTDENGAFAAEIPMPNNLMPGEHTAQVNGEALGGGLRSMNLGIEVALESPAALKRICKKNATLPIKYFSKMSARQARTLGPSQVLCLKRAQIRAISPRVLSVVRPETVRNLKLRQVKGLTASQARGLKPRQVASLKPKQRAAVKRLATVSTKSKSSLDSWRESLRNL